MSSSIEEEAIPLPRAQQLESLRTTLVDSCKRSKRLARAAAAAWRTMRTLQVEPSRTPLESLLPVWPLDLSLHMHSFLQPELSFSAGELHAVCRQWAITLAKQTWIAAQEDQARPNLLRSVNDHGRLIHLAACFGSDRPSLSVAVQTMSERLLLQLLHSRPLAGVSMAGRTELLQWLMRIVMTLPGMLPSSASTIFLRTVTLADTLQPTVSPAMHYMAALMCVANAMLHSRGETSMALTSAQASALMDGAYSPDEIRAAADAFRGRVLQQIADPSVDPPCSSPGDLLQTASGAEVAAAVFCIVSDVLAQIQTPWLTLVLSDSAELPSALWFTCQRAADGTESLQPLQLRDLCCNLEALPNWKSVAASSSSSSAASSSSSSSSCASDASTSALLSACKPLLRHWTPLLRQLWNLQPRPDVIAAILNCCFGSPALLGSSLIPSCANFAPLLPLEQTTWREALIPYTQAAAAVTAPQPLAAAVPSAASSVSPAAAPQKAPSKARWGLLKRALVKSAPADSSSPNDASSVSVHRHAGFKVLTMREVGADELQQLLPPGSGEAERSKYVFVRYDVPSEPTTSGSAASSVASPTASASDCSLLFRIRRAGSVSLAELAPDQKIDNTGNVCIWNSEEVLTHVALQLLRGPRSPSSLTGMDLPASLYALPSAAGRPLRILELGAGMSGLCGLALGYSRTLRSTIAEVVITDGNLGCVEGIQFQLAWNAALQQDRTQSTDSNTAHSDRISAQVLAWDRTADYSSLGKFDVILVADWSEQALGCCELAITSCPSRCCVSHPSLCVLFLSQFVFP